MASGCGDSNEAAISDLLEDLDKYLGNYNPRGQACDRRVQNDSGAPKGHHESDVKPVLRIVQGRVGGKSIFLAHGAATTKARGG
jgi:hypothetical protein